MMGEIEWMEIGDHRRWLRANDGRLVLVCRTKRNVDTHHGPPLVIGKPCAASCSIRAAGADAAYNPLRYTHWAAVELPEG